MSYTPARPLMAHQQEALSRMQGRDSFALLMEYGTGKSAVVVADAGRLYKEGELDGVLVLAPKGVYHDWGVGNPETSHWCLNLDKGVWEADLMVHLWRGGHTKNDRYDMEVLLSRDGLSVLAVDTEALSSGTRANAACEEFLVRRTCMLVVDESTMIKSPGAARTKKVLRLADLAHYRRILTGFPTPRSSLDLYTQFRFLDWRILGHKSYYSYRSRYAVMRPLYLGSRTVQQVVGYQNTEELWRRIEPHSYRVRADDCLDLPPQIYQRREVELPPETRRVYSELVEQCTTQLGDGMGHVSATLAITLIMRLHQAACGHITTETGEVRELPCRKMDALLELIDECDDEKIVVWCHFRPSLDRVSEALKNKFGVDSCVEYHGRVVESERQRAKEEFANNPECRFFVANQQTGGRGINDLVVARHAVYWSNPPDLELRLNSEARTRRRGSEHHSSVVYTDLVTVGTVEEKIIQALRQRLDMASLVVGDAWRAWLV